VQVLAYVSRVHNVECDVDQGAFTLEDVESNIVRCPDQEAAQKMIDGEQCWALLQADSQQQ
jgi:chorismate synthase